MKFSIITLIWKRDVGLLERMLCTLANQDLLPLEVIVVDINTESSERRCVRDVCNKYNIVKRLTHPMAEFHASRAVNIGIRASSTDADYIGVCGSEMLFSRNYLTALSQVITPRHFTRTFCGTMPDGVTVPDDPHSAWASLCASVDPKSLESMSPGTFMCAHRQWWFDIRGSDEGIYFLLFDVDLARRAELTGLTWLWLPWTDAQAIHQWHKPSRLFYTARGKWYPEVLNDTRIVRNPETWGTTI